MLNAKFLTNFVWYHGTGANCLCEMIQVHYHWKSGQTMAGLVEMFPSTMWHVVSFVMY